MLDLYDAPYDPVRPVVCFDESPKQWMGEVRDAIPPQPGTPARQDTEYQRNGVRDRMMICEPKRGGRDVLIMERRTQVEFAHSMRHIVLSYPNAEIVRVVLDNLNTHKAASLYAAFPPEEARAIARKLEFHYAVFEGSVGARNKNELACQCDHGSTGLGAENGGKRRRLGGDEARNKEKGGLGFFAGPRNPRSKRGWMHAEARVQAQRAARNS